MIDFIVDCIGTILIGLCAFLVLSIPFVIYMDMGAEDTRKECFMQEERTKECEYILWKYENRNRTSTAVMPMPIITR